MTTIQERLQMKRVPLDTWSTKEKLCLASSVVRSGDQNWMSVSRALKSFGDANRPVDWFSQKSCAAQYDSLLGPVEKPKRKTRTPDGSAETPQENILKKLTTERIDELQKKMTDMKEEYRKLQDEIEELQSNTTSDDRIRDMWTEMEAERRQEEQTKARLAQWLRDRDEQKTRAERSWRPANLPSVSAASQPGASPLLTSLLKSPSPAPTVSQTHLLHMSHSSNISDTLSPSAGAPTLSMLLEKPAGMVTHSSQLPAPPLPAPDTNKNAIIEQIKCDLQQLEKKIIGGMNSPTVTLPSTNSNAIRSRAKTPEKIDIDDIEIKEEDVYVFSDIDLEIPPVSSIHKSIVRSLDKSIFKKEASLPALEDLAEPHDFGTDSIVEENLPSAAAPQHDVDVTVENVEYPQSSETKQDNVAEGNDIEEIPTTQISNDLPPPADKASTVEETAQSNPSEEATIKEELDESVEQTSFTKSDEKDIETEPEAADSNTSLNSPINNLGPPEGETQLVTRLEEESQPEKEDSNKAEVKEPIITEIKVEAVDTSSVEQTEDAEASQPPIAVIDADASLTTADEVKETNLENEEDHPMEVIREEDKLGRTKRDYSRKKPERESTDLGQICVEAGIKTEPVDDSVDFTPLSIKSKNKIYKSRSESPCTPIDSLPGSPSTPMIPLHTVQPSSVKTPSTSSTSSSIDDDKDHRLWKKSIMLVYSRLCSHKNASIFSRPITDEQAPGYSSAIKRPMDLQTIKRQVDAGIVRTTSEFHRDVLLMLSNALMYNSSSHHVYSMAQEMHHEAAVQLGILLQAQAHASMSISSTPTRRAHTSVQVQPVLKKKRGGDSTSSTTSSTSKKRKEDSNE